VTVAFFDLLLQEVYKIPKLTLEERKRTERELGGMFTNSVEYLFVFSLFVIMSKQ